MDNITIAFRYEKNIERNTLDAGRNLRTTRGLLYHKLGESDKGIAELKEALKKNEKNSYAMKNLGIIYLDQHKYKKACELFRTANELKYSLVYAETDLPSLLESACNSAPLEVTDLKKPFVSPNPVSTIISVENFDLNFEYEFFSFESISVLKGKSTNGKIDVSTLASGFYVLKVVAGNSTEIFRVIKE